ncbi:translation initiation factor IF-2 [Horticoccus luteus]|uniref:Translation initiation factor IF-2 n=1 Tax=Horticoccus luteus TaxID=2862869 RepID=A0A8F9TWG9_9BACT|nr:translation initiation factor IF-2 [Horticoccus luteus]QYM80370.1 translation initiation factor IF-2 [Horticoccus luteus]
MSIRIHKLAEELGLENKELLSLLRERKIIGAEVKSVSSTVDNINADALREEFGPRAAAVATEAVASPAEETTGEGAAAPQHPEEPEVSRVNLPAGVFVKSADDIVREKEAAAKAAAAAKNPPPTPVPAAAPAARPAASVPPPLPAKAPPSVPPPLPPIAKAPPSVPAPVSAPRPVNAPPMIPAPLRAPATPPVTARPLSAAPSTPPPISRPPSAPVPPPVVSAPPLAPAVPGAGAIAPATSSGEVKLLPMKPPIIVRDLAVALGLKPFKLISEVSQATGGFAGINSSLDEPVAMKIAEKYGFLLEVKHRGEAVAPQKVKTADTKAKIEEEEQKNLTPRPPVICILGHVDHGKTSLLDAIRKANVASGEAGGITQHIGAYQIEFQGKKLTFLDTPGHAAFSKMRARGADVTDIAVLVVAADDGFMPQTDEALKHAQNADVAIIVAVNKMDVKGANIEQVKSQMQQRNIAPEDWGGETITVPVSAIKGTGVDQLLEMILLQAEVLELKANPKAEASGVVIESEIEIGRGSVATVIVQRGTLRVGDALVCGQHWTRVKALFSDKGEQIKEATPSTPVRIIGWSGTPDSGATFRAVKNPREAERLAEEAEQRTRKEATVAAAEPKEVSVEQLFADIAATQHKVLKLLIKTDVFGSTEALRSVLDGIKSTKVQVEVLAADVGLVTKNDVLMASASGAVIVGFNTKLENGVTPLAKHHNVRIESFQIIYELGDKVREMMADLLEPEQKEAKLGAAEVRATFPLAKGFVAGCLVTEGKINRNAMSRLRRGREVVYEGKVDTLKRFKDDANEVRAGLECGIKLDDFNGYQIGDVIESYEIQKVRASL